MNKTNLRPKKCYGKSLRRNKGALDDMLERRLLGETYAKIGKAYGVTAEYAWTLLNKNH